MINGLYNNNYEIIDSKDYVVIRANMVRPVKLVLAQRFATSELGQVLKLHCMTDYIAKRLGTSHVSLFDGALFAVDRPRRSGKPDATTNYHYQKINNRLCYMASEDCYG